VREAGRRHAVDHQGEMYTVRRYRPTWAVSPPPLIYAAANKPQMLRMAARCADGVMVGDMTPAKLREVLGILDAALAASGRSRADFHISNFWAWHIKKDRQGALREARRELALRGMLNEWYLRPFLSEKELELVRAHRGAFFRAFSQGSDVIEGVPAELVDTLIENLTCTGSLDDLDRQVERLREFARLGLSEIALRLHDDPEQAIRVIGEAVVPALQQGGPHAD
jgi:alkanesulfonate monooxygenase SsuD/methylene tetrahydromethanopterin reductase-like flavin-dependent oxidoreductase (luciferase family)